MSAYANYDIHVNASSFGQAKTNFTRSLIKFTSIMVLSVRTYPHNTPVSTVRAEYYAVHSVPQWLTYLDWHKVPWTDLPVEMTMDQLNAFYQLPTTVWSRWWWWWRSWTSSWHTVSWLLTLSFPFFVFQLQISTISISTNINHLYNYKYQSSL